MGEKHLTASLSERKILIGSRTASIQFKLPYTAQHMQHHHNFQTSQPQHGTSTKTPKMLTMAKIIGHKNTETFSKQLLSIDSIR